MMRSTPCTGRPWVGLLTLLFLVMTAGCTEKKESPPPRQRPDLKPVVSWLDRHYRSSPPGNGWKISSVASQGDQVQIKVAIPPDQASVIMRRPAQEQFSAVASAVCPAKGAEVYRMLPTGADLKVLPTASGEVFIEVDCGH